MKFAKGWGPLTFFVAFWAANSRSFWCFLDPARIAASSESGGARFFFFLGSDDDPEAEAPLGSMIRQPGNRRPGG